MAYQGNLPFFLTYIR